LLPPLIPLLLFTKLESGAADTCDAKKGRVAKIDMGVSRFGLY
jgi:hypothetical protein